MAPRAGSRALQLFRPLAALMPEVRRADRVVPLGHRVLYTGMSVSVFLVCSHLPLYGIRHAASRGADPLYLMRSLLASSRGTLMELGVAPVVTAGTVMQLLVGSKLLRVDHNVREDRELMDAGRKVLATAIALAEAAAQVLLGVYGGVGVLNGALIVLQLFSASVIVIFIEDLLEKGYGLPGASAVSLLASTNTCGKVAWQVFSPVTVDTGRGPEFEGLALAVAHHAFVRGGNVIGTLLRQHLPNMVNLLATGAVLLAAVFLEGFRVLLPLRYRDARGRWTTFPIKLLYTSTMPIVLYSAVVSALYMFSQLLYYSRFGGGVLTRLLGTWKETSYAAVPVGGLAYYVTAPSGLMQVATDPLHALTYVALLLTSCALLSQAWVTASGSSAKDVARQLADQRLAVAGTRDGTGAIHSQLRRYIPTAAALGGLCVGVLTIFADMTGAIGSGTGILLAGTTVYNLIDNFKNWQ